jgi:hypothetical protein
MAIQMTREEYEKKYGVPPGVLSKPAREAASAPQPQRPFLERATNAITNFVGARGIADQYGASLARTQLRAQGKPDAAALVENPSFKEVAGSAIETGSMLIPGAGVGASLARKATIGGATGYGIDAGSELQAGGSVTEAATPGFGTLIGAALPIVGRIIGAAPKSLEQANLRMTPVEQQNLIKRGKDIVSYLAQQKVVGTPAQRLAQVQKLYTAMEDKVAKTISDTGMAIPKDEIIETVTRATKNYQDDPIALPEVEKAIREFVGFLDRKDTFAIPLSEINNYKRTIMERAFAKNKADVVNEGKYAVAVELKRLLDDEVDGLRTLNQEYSDIITARRVLAKALTRNQSGLLTRALATGTGAAAGGTFGGFFGAAVGGAVAERLANNLATPIRSATGAGIQTLGELLGKLPVDEKGNIPAKLLIQALTGDEQEDAE